MAVHLFASMLSMLCAIIVYFVLLYWLFSLDFTNTSEENVYILNLKKPKTSIEIFFKVIL